jgi:hypothetical protein
MLRPLAVALFALTLLTACEDPAGTVAFSVGANEHNPFSVLVEVWPQRDASVWVEAGEDGEFDRMTPTAAIDGLQSAQVVLHGLEADRTYDVRVVAEIDGEIRESEIETWITDPLPSGFPEVETRWSDDAPPGDDREVICTNGRRHGIDDPDGIPLYYCFDRDGSPVWSLEHPEEASLLAVRATSDGGFAATSDSSSLLALFDDRCARTAEYSPLWFEGRTRYLHVWIDMHEVIELKEGPWAGALAFLTGVGDTVVEDTFLLGYGLIVFDPRTEEVLWDWTSHGELGDGVPIDPKLEYDRLSPLEEEQGDWLHANGLAHGLDPDGSQFFWMSLRHQDWILKIDVDTDEVVWRLGAAGDFELVADLDETPMQLLSPELWMYHQHSPEIVSRQGDRTTFLVFDNGNVRRDADGEWDLEAVPYSRVAGFEVDETLMRVAPTFVWGSSDPEDPAHFYTAGRGDADLLPDGDRLQYVVGWLDTPYIAEVSYPEGEPIWWAAMPDGNELYRVNYFPSLYDTTWAYDGVD